jgi:SAM-dependent methyltransferase
MNFTPDVFISCRRSHLDAQLGRVKGNLRGDVLDVGGRKNRRRGGFVPPLESVRSWTIVNPDETAGADVCAALPVLPFSNSEFDFVLCTEVLEYIQAPASAVKELARVLRTDGTLYLSVPFLHVLHGDAEIDRVRFTVTYIRELVEAYFYHVEIFPMGGIASVVFDLVWQRMRRRPLLRPIFRILGHWITRGQHTAVDITTGFFVVARVPKIGQSSSLP